MKLMTFSYKAVIIEKRSADMASLAPLKSHSESSVAEQLTVRTGIQKKNYLRELIKKLDRGTHHPQAGSRHE